jgi:hypothetical protein
MSRRLESIFICILVSSLIFAGCSEDATAPPGESIDQPGLVQVDIDPNAGEFEFTFDANCRGDEPAVGHFVIRGTNIHYESRPGALVADITVTNLTRCSFAEPIWLTFVDLMPDSVTVINPDNDQFGPGAAIMFHFANDDGRWTPHEESLPRMVQFGVGPGQGIGFVGRIDVGADTSLGAIGGVVWNDVDEDGVMDPGEPGIGGHVITMQRTDGPELLWRTQTAHDGSYRFDDLHPGHYQVTKEPVFGCKNTTPTVIQVFLVEYNGQVSDFLEADFGCVPLIGPTVIEVGDAALVSGEYAADPHRVVAGVIDVYKCDLPGAGNDANLIVLPPCRNPFSELMGSVTDIDLDERALAVMGTWVVFDSIPDSTLWWDEIARYPCLDLEDVEIGDRVRVRVLGAALSNVRVLTGIGLWEWPERDDRVHGRVEQVVIMPPPGRPSEIVVLGTRIMITDGTRINFHYWQNREGETVE